MCLVFSKCDLSIPMCTVWSYHKYFVLIRLVQKPISIHQTQHISVIENQLYNRYMLRLMDTYCFFYIVSTLGWVMLYFVIFPVIFSLCFWSSSVYPAVVPGYNISNSYTLLNFLCPLPWICYHTTIMGVPILCELQHGFFSYFLMQCPKSNLFICLFSCNSYFPHKGCQNPNI